jgi:cytochrome o ubiquinol oxidase subunit 1
MWIPVALLFAATILATIVHTFNYRRDFHIDAGTVTRSEEARTAALAAAI